MIAGVDRKCAGRYLSKNTIKVERSDQRGEEDASGFEIESGEVVGIGGSGLGNTSAVTPCPSRCGENS